MKTRSGRLLRWLLVLFILVWLRGWLYRQVVAYQEVGIRQEYLPRNPRLLEMLEKKWVKLSAATPPQNIEMSRVVKIAQVFTAENLTYKWASCPSDPNLLMDSHAANCIGYAAFCSAACNSFFQKAGISDEWVAHPVIGNLYVLGMNIHPWCSSAFFRNHDFVMVENKRTGEVRAIDPTVYEVASIEEVKCR